MNLRSRLLAFLVLVLSLLGSPGEPLWAIGCLPDGQGAARYQEGDPDGAHHGTLADGTGEEEEGEGTPAPCSEQQVTSSGCGAPALPGVRATLFYPPVLGEAVPETAVRFSNQTVLPVPGKPPR